MPDSIRIILQKKISSLFMIVALRIEAKHHKLLSHVYSIDDEMARLEAKARQLAEESAKDAPQQEKGILFVR